MTNIHLKPKVEKLNGIMIILSTDSSSVNSGLFGGMERQANMVENARNDKCSPPSDGRVTENQIATLILNLKKTADYQKSQDLRITKTSSDLIIHLSLSSIKINENIDY